MSNNSMIQIWKLILAILLLRFCKLLDLSYYFLKKLVIRRE